MKSAHDGALNSTSFTVIGRKIAARRPSVLAAMLFPVAERVEQIFDRPVGAFGGKQIGGGAVLPDAVANRRRRVGLQLRLGQQPAEITGQRVSAPALRQQRIAGAETRWPVISAGCW